MKKKGFSLVELLVAIVILGIMASGMSSLQSARIEYARRLRAERDIADIQEALACYLYFHGEDVTGDGLEDIGIDTLFRKGFLLGENQSPWGEPYKLTIRDSAVSIDPSPDGRNRTGGG